MTPTPLSAPSASQAQTLQGQTRGSQKPWTAVILAGQRPEGDPLAEFYGQEFKALIPVGGISMLARVTRTLLNSPHIGRVVILAQEPAKLLTGDTAELADNPNVHLSVSSGGIAASISTILGNKITPWPVFVTTADHALLTTEMVNDFLADAHKNDIAVGVGARSLVEQRYPIAKRTWLKFSDDHYSGANLFSFRSANVVPALEHWATIEKDRKKSWKIISSFGPYLLLRILTRTIGLEAAVNRAGKRLGISIGIVKLAQAEAVIDVDKPTDHQMAESILLERQTQSESLLKA